jgi:hypothetical protein
MPISIGTIQFDEKWLYRQLKRDLRDDWFTDPLFYTDVFDAKLIEQIVAANLAENHGQYEPADRALLNIPKPNFTLRYALETSIADRAIYQGLAMHLIPFFDPLFRWNIFSHRYNPKASNRESIFHPHVQAWSSFLGSVRSAVQPNSYLVTTDLSNYYEHVQISLLEKTLLGSLPSVVATVEQKAHIREHISALIQFLSKWGFSRERGLPQNRDASSFLANMYMHPVDHAMSEYEGAYFRYMDDIKIVCNDMHSARLALKRLIVALRNVGLNVNAKKTEIVPGSNTAEIERCLGSTSPEILALDTIWNTRSRAAILKALPALMRATLKLVESQKTDSRDFRFCVRRLSWLAQCDDMGVPPEFFAELTPRIIQALADAPASTDEFVTYLAAVELTQLHLESISSFLCDQSKSIYTWQNYRLWLLLAQRDYRDDSLKQHAISLLSRAIDDANCAGASVYLGKHGSVDDRRHIAKNFNSFRSFLGQRSALIGLHELKYRPDIEDHVKPTLRKDLKGVFQNLSLNKGVYFAKKEDVSITKFVRREGDHDQY